MPTMNLDQFRRIQLSDTEILSAQNSLAQLRTRGGDTLAIINDLARQEHNAYHTQGLSTQGTVNRVRVAKRLRALGMMQAWLSTEATPQQGNLFPEQVSPEQQANDQTASLRAHLFAAMVTAALEAKKKGEDPAKVIAELKRLGTDEGLEELKRAMAQMQSLGLTVEGVVWLNWIRSSSRTGKTRWFNESSGEYRYQETEPGTRQAAQEAEAKVRPEQVTEQESVKHLDQLASQLKSVSLEDLERLHKQMGTWLVNGQALQKDIVEKVKTFAQKTVQQKESAEKLSGIAPIPGTTVHPDSKIVNKIDPKAAPEEKVRQLSELTKQNQPVVDEFLSKLDAKFGTESKSNVKMPERILQKAERPSIKAKKPWFDVEHIRDSFRFKTVLKDIRDLPGIVDYLKSDLGAEIVKKDTDKFGTPERWGWRIIAFDLKMPNGQLVEYYLPVEEMEKQKKDKGHELFERWRNRDITQLSHVEQLEFERDTAESRLTYQQAFDAYLSRTGNSESDIRAALAKVDASISSDTGVKPSSSSSKENLIPDAHLPPDKEAAKPLSKTKALPSGDFSQVATKEPSGSDKGIVSTDEVSPKQFGELGSQIYHSMPHGGFTLAALMAHHKQGASAIDKHLNDLEAAGWVEQDEKDGRWRSLSKAERAKKRPAETKPPEAAQPPAKPETEAAKPETKEPVAETPKIPSSVTDQIQNIGRQSLPRLFEQAKALNSTQETADYIAKHRPDLADELTQFKPETPAKAPEQVKEPKEVRHNGHPGKESDIVVPGGKPIKARYEVRELGEVRGSAEVMEHGGFRQREHHEYHEGLQPRDYRATTEQAKVLNMAENMNPGYWNSNHPDATSGPPVISPDGTVINGNGRHMALEMSRNVGTYDKYRADLMRQAQQFGIDPERLKGMKHPALYRVVDMEPSSPEAKDFARRGNVASTQTQSPVRVAKSLGDLVNDDVINSMRLEGDTTFSEAVTHPDKGKAFRQQLKEAIPAESRDQYFHPDGKLTDAGTELVRNMLLSKILPVDLIERAGQEMKAEKKTLEAAIPQIMKLRRDYPDADPSPQLIAALGVIARNPKMRTVGDADNVLSQQSLFGGNTEHLDPAERMMLDFLLQDGQKSKVFRDKLSKLVAGEEAKTGLFGEHEDDPLTMAAAALGVKPREGAVFGRTDGAIKHELAIDPKAYESKVNHERDAAVAAGEPVPEVEAAIREGEAAGKVEGAKPVSEGKPKIHEMTKAQFHQQLTNQRGYDPGARLAGQLHKNAIADALGKGETVKPEILAEHGKYDWSEHPAYKGAKEELAAPKQTPLSGNINAHARQATPAELANDRWPWQGFAQTQTDAGTVSISAGGDTREEAIANARELLGKKIADANKPATAGEKPIEQQAGVSHDDNLERKGDGGSQGGLHAEGELGADAAKAPEPVLPGAGEGVGPGAGRLPSGNGVGGDGSGGAPTGQGNRPASSAGAGDGGPAASPGGRTGQSGTVGAGRRGSDGDGSGGRIPNPSPVEKAVTKPPTPDNPTDTRGSNFKYTSRDFVPTGLKGKFWANIEALKTLQAIRAEGRTAATPEEQAIMSRFVGWGQFPALMNEYGEYEWQKERAVLKGLISPEEWESAKGSILNAHYTHPDVVDAHWKMAERLGYSGGRFLETSAGIGYYLGMMPDNLRSQTKASAVELDELSGGMMKLLYPRDNVQIQGFQEHNAPDGFYDLVASNVPFGDYKVHDPRYNKHQAQIHDYFFLKSADKVRPGGLVMHITSKGTLDKGDPAIRKELAKTCDLVAALRFPGQTHKENAGTDVVTDMLILRKRQPGEQPNGIAWTETTSVPDPAGGAPIPVNEYFAKHPEQVLGTLDRTGTMYRGDSVNVSKTEDYEDRLKQAIERLPQNLMTKATAPKERFEPEAMPAPGDVKDGGFKVEKGKVYVRDGGGMVEQEMAPAKVAKIEAHIGVRDAKQAVINAQLKGEDATAARADLNRVYDAFVKKHGFLSDRGNRLAFKDDPDSPTLLALENYDPKTKKATKADIFHKDTVRHVAKVETASDVPAGLGVSLHETGGVSVDHIAKLTGLSKEHVAKHLADNGLAYEDPSDGWKPADQYLAGNVRRKLALAKAAAEADPKFKANVAALEKVQPEDLDHEDIDVKLGAPWVPPTDIADFASNLVAGGRPAFQVKHIPATGAWMADLTRQGIQRVSASRVWEQWSTPRKGFDTLFEAALNNTPVSVYDKIDDKQVLNSEATADANAKVQEIKDSFKEWIWTDDDRRQRLHRHYNDNFNNIRAIKYDGQHQQFPGMNPAIKLHKHIPDFVWQVVSTGKGLAAHEVGTGKTYAMIASAMELRRLGLARKPAIACMKANIGAITADCLKLYPGAKILSTADMFDAANRKKTMSRIATGDYDIVLFTHDNMDMLQMKPETVKAYINDEIKELEAARAASEAENPAKNNRVVKALEKAKARLVARLQEALDASTKDDAVFFEELGVDHLFVDEAHKYKSLPCYTKQERLKGVPTSRSDRATGMLMRTRWLMEQNGGRGVTFATGTPVTNTMAELYNMQRYLQPEQLKERGIESFDSWANVFGDVQTKMEFGVTGEYKPVSRFAKFVNIPELMQMSQQIMDVQRIENMPGTTIERPNRKDKVTAAYKSEAMTDLMEQLKKRAQALKGQRPGPGMDNMLAICTDGRKGSIDMRLLDRDAEDDPKSKTNLAINNVLKIHKDNPGKTQLIFSDIGVNPVKNGFHLYGDIIDKLVKGGIPREQIVDFSALNTDKAKIAAQEAMRKGEIRIGIGSTEKMGTGVNVQNKLMALHHLDVPWRPSDVEQRDGRGWRHGNDNKDLHIHRYVTEGSLDQTFWQIIGNKTRFIKQVMTPGEKVERVAKDEDTEELSAEQLMAAASGDPRILEKVQLDDDLRNLQSARERHDRQQYRLKQSIASGERHIPFLKAQGDKIRAVAKKVEERPDYEIEMDGKTYLAKPGTAEREEALKVFETKKNKIDAIMRSTDSMAARDQVRHVGTYRGLRIVYRGGYFNLVDDDDEMFRTGESITSIGTVARNLKSLADESDEKSKQAADELDKLRPGLGKAFPKSEELEKKLARSKALEKELSGKKDDDDDKPKHRTQHDVDREVVAHLQKQTGKVVWMDPAVYDRYHYADGSTVPRHLVDKAKQEVPPSYLDEMDKKQKDS